MFARLTVMNVSELSVYRAKTYTFSVRSLFSPAENPRDFPALHGYVLRQSLEGCGPRDYLTHIM